MFKRGTVAGALLTMAVSAAAFYGTLWIVPYFANSSFMVYRDDHVYLAPVIQIPIFAVVGASLLGGAWGLLQIILILTARLKRHRHPIVETHTDEGGVWPPAPTAPRFK